MAFDEGLAQRVRDVIDAEGGIEEKRMFGGLAFMVAGNMAVGVIGDDLVVRLGEEGASEALDEPHTSPMDFTGRVMRTMVYVSSDGVAEDDDLARWVSRGVSYAGSLDPK